MNQLNCCWFLWPVFAAESCCLGGVHHVHAGHQMSPPSSLHSSAPESTTKRLPFDPVLSEYRFGWPITPRLGPYRQALP